MNGSSSEPEAPSPNSEESSSDVEELTTRAPQPAAETEIQPEVAAQRSQQLSRRKVLAAAGGVAGVGLGVTAAALIGRSQARQAAPSAPASPVMQETPPPSVTPTPSAPAPAPALPAAQAQELCRDAWGAQPARPGGVPHTINRMTLHHTAVVLGDNSNAPARLRQHQTYHQNHGWIDIAYHVSVDRNGNIYELRDYNLAGDTFTEYNPAGHFLVLCEGDFDQEEVSEAQLQSAALVFAWAAQQFGISTDTLGGHRDFASTSCPGNNLYAVLESGDLKRRVDGLIAAGPVELIPFCGEEAAARVAEIEAGG